MIEEVCMGCGWKTSGGACLMWKYISPEICKQLNDEIDNIPLRAHQSLPLESVNVIRVLCGFNYSADPEIKPTGTYYKYSKIHSIMKGGEWITISRESITRGEYEAFLKDSEKV